jgi:hypothetical protein
VVTIFIGFVAVASGTYSRNMLERLTFVLFGTAVNFYLMWVCLYMQKQVQTLIFQMQSI